jgi:formate hydrogenlyase subunit 6/NADH:ubiquinone oxidoreductase subunit I
MKLGSMLRQLMSSLFKKPATVCYPFEKLEMAEKLRGKLFFTPKLCIGCKMCEKDCPSDAIKITKTGEKQFEAEIRLDKCIYCAQCVDTCPKKALSFTQEIELAGPDVKKLRVVYRDTPDSNAPKTSP